MMGDLPSGSVNCTINWTHRHGRGQCIALYTLLHSILTHSLFSMPVDGASHHFESLNRRPALSSRIARSYSQCTMTLDITYRSTC